MNDLTGDHLKSSRYVYDTAVSSMPTKQAHMSAPRDVRTASKIGLLASVGLMREKR